MALLVAAGGAFAAVRLSSGDGKGGGDGSVDAATTVPTGVNFGEAGTTVAGDAQTTVQPDGGGAGNQGKAGSHQASGGGGSRSGPYAGAMNAFEQYWKYVAAGDYAAAYGMYYAGWATSEADFVAAEKEASPKIAVGSLNMKPRTNDGSTVTLDASVILRDRSGQYAGQCRLLSGWVRFVRSGSQWKYRPGIVNGEQPSFAQAPQVLHGNPDCP